MARTQNLQYSMIRLTFALQLAKVVSLLVNPALRTSCFFYCRSLTLVRAGVNVRVFKGSVFTAYKMKKATQANKNC